MRRKLVILIGVILLGLTGVNIVGAHANLVHTDPAPNAVLDQSPDEIRLWFTEPLEPAFSYIRLRDANGNPVNTPAPSELDPDFPQQMVLRPGDLPDGLYTVVWLALSAADGHETVGTYPLTIGASVSGSQATAQGEAGETVPPDRAAIRWVNLLSLALAVGSVSFRLFVWNLAVSEPQPQMERRMDRLMWVGWALVGVSGILLLLMQISTALGEPLLSGITGDVLGRIIANTRFGHIWLVRMALWLGMGGALLFAPGDRWFMGVALVIGLALLGTNSLFSHAVASADSIAATAADYLHLLATAFWVGGLSAFVSVIGPVRRTFQESSVVLSNLVAYFTNFARAAVVILIVTGLYAAWLQVGSIEGLLTTLYGQALVVKLLLIAPLLAIGASNMLLTHRGLQAGSDVWAGRLRNLVGAEIALTLGVFAAVGVMTSIPPARSTLALRAASVPAIPDNTITLEQTQGKLDVQLQISPGWVGENTFTLTIKDQDGNPVSDASLIRMRFREAQLGESELRPENLGSGVYSISGSNLSIAGQWRIRTSIRRPNEFDTVIDFEPQMSAPPPVQQPHVLDPNGPLPNRVPALLLTGVVALAAGGFFLAENWRSLRRGASVLGGGLALVAWVFLVSGAQALGTPQVTALADSGFQPAANDLIRLGFSPTMNLPYLITEAGTILEPDASGAWHPMALDAHATDIYGDSSGTIYAATYAGLEAYQNGAWQKLDDTPASRVIQTHGYLFALGNGDVMRLPLGPGSPEQERALNLPAQGQIASEFVMLGNHSHVLQSGSQIYRTPDLGLSWEPLNAPAPVQTIWIDGDGNLLVTTATGILTWNYQTGAWSGERPLPDGRAVDMLRVFNNSLYTLAGGRLYRWEGSDWSAVSLPGANINYLTAIETQYPDTFWALDGPGRFLWSTPDGSNWTLTTVQISAS